MLYRMLYAPFGKYKGQPIDDLLEDRDYCDWLCDQSWFEDKYSDLYMMIAEYEAELNR